MAEEIRVLLAENHEAVRQGLCALLHDEEGIALVADVGDGPEAVEAAKTLSPDVVVMDLSMPSSGLVALRQIKTNQPRTSIVVLSRHRDSAFVKSAMDGGAHGYVIKQSPFSELMKAVRAAARGEIYMDSHLPQGVTTKSRHLAADLSGRECEVLRRTAAGLTNKEIGAELRISVKTVEAHKANGMRKLRLPDRAAIVSYAVLHGWLSE